MAGSTKLSPKRVQIDKAATFIVVAVSLASFIVVFSLIASKALLSQRSYLSRVITKKEQARDQLNANIKATDELVVSYKAFANASQNVLEGSPTGDGPKDGDNAKIILDALPSKYDFPALTSSIEGILNANSMKITNITGRDDEVVQGAAKLRTKPKSVDMPFEFSADGSFASVRKLINYIEHSIRPIYIDNLTLEGTDNDIKVSVKAKTFYQPEISLKVETETVK